MQRLSRIRAPFKTATDFSCELLVSVGRVQKTKDEKKSRIEGFNARALVPLKGAGTRTEPRYMQRA